MALHFSDVPALENFRDARARLSRLPSLCAGVFRNVRYRRLAPRLDKKSKVNNVGYRISRICLAVALCFAPLAALLAAAPARAGEITLPPEAVRAMDKMYSGDPDGASALMEDLLLQFGNQVRHD